MKNFVLILGVLGLIFSSCGNGLNEINALDEDPVIELSQYKNIVYENRNLLSDWAYALLDAEEKKYAFLRF